MKTPLRFTPAPLVALLAGCIDIPAPREQTPPDGATMQPLEPDEGQDPGGPAPPPWQPVPGMPSEPCASPGPSCPADAGAGGGAGGAPADAGGSDAGAGSPGTGSPGVGPRSCEAAGQSFADGEVVPSGDDCNTCRCDGGSIACTEAACDPVFCAEFVEEPDGVCARFPLDPCAFQDPECVDAPAPETPTAAP